jgi:DNA-binding Xre family transcriptional regulator
MITLNLHQVFKTRGITKGYSFLVKNGISPGTAKTLMYNKPRAIRLDHIEILCKTLVCEPSDLFTYTPEKKDTLPDTHPLKKLIRDPEEASLKQTISHLSYQELIEIKKLIKSQKTSPSAPIKNE